MRKQAMTIDRTQRGGRAQLVDGIASLMISTRVRLQDLCKFKYMYYVHVIQLDEIVIVALVSVLVEY
jgi:hypothetical protein